MKSKRSRHGGHVSAPAEDVFVPGESPTPPKVGKHKRGESPEGTPGFFRALWSLTKLGAGILLVICVSGAVAWGAHRYALTTPRFAIKKLEVEGSRRKTDEQIATLAGVKLGDNIFKLDTAAAEKRVLEDPWVKDVKIARELPNTLKIELSEREAAAIAAVNEQMYLVTRGGEPFKRLEEGDPFDLPVVTGVSAEELARDRTREVERIGVALEILRHWERIDVSKTYPAQEVHLTAGGDAVLTAGKSAITLHLGRGPWRKKMLMAERVIGRLARKGRVPGIIFLDSEAHPERVVVRMR